MAKSYRGKANPSLHAGDGATPTARNLRREASPPERVLWSRIRGGQRAGRFRRQHPLGPCIADFSCHEAALVVEVDGADHQGERIARDARRDSFMHGNGVTVVRVSASDVQREPDAVLRTIRSPLEVAVGREIVASRVAAVNASKAAPSVNFAKPR